MRAFLELYQARLYALARRLLRDEEAARDALQDVLIQVDRSLPKFAGEASLYTWAFRIAVNVCLNMQRGLRSKSEHVSVDDILLPISAEEDPDAMCARSFRTFVVDKALLRLPETQRVALTLHDIEEMTAPEVAAVLHIDAGAVKARVRRARATLRTLIADEYRARGMEIDGVSSITCVGNFLEHGTADESRVTS